MSKAKTNALDALRALIAERQQYEQWISALEAKREGTPEHVFERVQKDYGSRLDRVVDEIKGHAEELQLSISTLSSRLVEVARDEDTRREGLQEAELRAAVGEYEPAQWDQIRSEAEEALSKIAADRQSLDSQLGELRSIQKLAEMGPGGGVTEPATAPIPEIIRPLRRRQVMWRCLRLQLLANRNHRDLLCPRRPQAAGIVWEQLPTGRSHQKSRRRSRSLRRIRLRRRSRRKDCHSSRLLRLHRLQLRQRRSRARRNHHRAGRRRCVLVQKQRSPMPQRRSSVPSAVRRTIQLNGIASGAVVSSLRCKTKRAPRGARLISY
jgi:hypothetical protein